jgi:xanthine dehydrogenase YagS FAD-binding subunit
MRELEYVRATDVLGAVRAVAERPDEAVFLGGGTNLVDHLKLGVAAPRVVVDVTGLPLDEVEEYDDARGVGMSIGANVRNSDLAAHPVVRRDFPAVARALLAGASGQIRNQATTAGNLLQRTRCVYFQDVTTPCNKRDPGSGCSALEGYGRYNAILGWTEDCVTTHPSDLAVALAALDATVVVVGAGGERRVPVRELHRLPDGEPHRDTVLAAGELITSVELPREAVAARSTYRKVRDRASYAFALVSVAAALDLDGDQRVRDVRVAWGGVAHKPWRAERLEATLVGRPLTEETVSAALARELADARATDGTAYKLPMLRGATTATLLGLQADPGTEEDHR